MAMWGGLMASAAAAAAALAASPYLSIAGSSSPLSTRALPPPLPLHNRPPPPQQPRPPLPRMPLPHQRHPCALQCSPRLPQRCRPPHQSQRQCQPQRQQQLHAVHPLQTHARKRTLSLRSACAQYLGKPTRRQQRWQRRRRRRRRQLPLRMATGKLCWCCEV
jgi:hypothetical protein